MDNQISKTKCGILLNRMYVGKYLNNNLGHEVINLGNNIVVDPKKTKK